MVHDAEPVIGSWYEHEDKGQKFSVVEVDEDSGLVEVQFFDGSVDQIDFDDWYELQILPIEAPKDWSGPMDSMEPDELDAASSGYEVQGWETPYDDTRLSKTGAERELPRRMDEANPVESRPEEEEPKEKL